MQWADEFALEHFLFIHLISTISRHYLSSSWSQLHILFLLFFFCVFFFAMFQQQQKYLKVIIHLATASRTLRKRGLCFINRTSYCLTHQNCFLLIPLSPSVLFMHFFFLSCASSVHQTPFSDISQSS